MSIFLIDPENGNDGNDGLTFANRWKTLTSGATAARIAPGDEIRVMASRSPQNVGLGQWTDGSTFPAGQPYRRVGLGTPPFLVADDCEDGWVASANVTVAHAATSPVPRTGSFRLALTFAAAFTTGKAAYKTLAATTDFSAFQQLSFWIAPTGTTVTCNMQICLCSDANGDVVVDTLTFDLGTSLVLSQWRNVLIDKGSALSAGINSIAIYVVADPHASSSRTICFDNIVACKGPDDPACITHRSLIGKNTVGEPWWYGIWGLTGADVVLGSNYDVTQLESAPQTPRYIGVTENVNSWIINPTTGWDSAARTINEGGSPGSPIRITGGWNRTDMSTQDGETWLTGYHFLGNAVTCSVMWVDVEKIGAAHYTGTAFPMQQQCRVTTPGLIGCGQAFSNFNQTTGLPSKCEFVCDQIWGLRDGFGETLSGGYRVEVGLIHGGGIQSTKYGLMIAEYADGIDELQIGRVRGCYQGGMRVTAGGVELTDTIFEFNQSADITFENYTGGVLHLNNVTTSAELTGTSSLNGGTNAIKETRKGGDPNLHRTLIAKAAFESQNTVVHTAGYAWKFTLDYTYSVSSAAWNYTDWAPARFELAQFAVEANKLVTVKCWLRRSDTAFQAGLEFRDKALPGVTRVTAMMTAGVDTWEEVTVTCTPTAAGVLTVNAIGYGSGTATKTGILAYFDDIDITQAA